MWLIKASVWKKFAIEVEGVTSRRNNELARSVFTLNLPYNLKRYNVGCYTNSQRLCLLDVL